MTEREKRRPRWRALLLKFGGAYLVLELAAALAALWGLHTFF